jgi:crotonobetainyl-CoA:carnitine CoA-transferase CaiB-like acyl-CoA transferase
MKALAGIRVVDFTSMIAGPYCTRLLADCGAEVLKIEEPHGDHMRTRPPLRHGHSAYFGHLNAGKKSVVLDLKSKEGRCAAQGLVAASDIVVENFRPGVMKRLGLDYAMLSAAKPDLVYCSISGFGQSGPLRHQPAFHHIINAMSGIMHLEQQTDPAPRPGYLQAADVLAGTHAFGAILAALWRRTRTGRGAYLDVSMLECMVGAEDINYGGMLNAGQEYRGPRPGMVVHGIGDRHVAMQTVGAPQLWPRLVAMMDRPDLASDARFATPAGRRENWAALHPIICAWLDTFKTVDEAVKTLTAARVPAATVLSPGEVVAHPHLAERQAFPEIAHPGRGTVRITAVPFHVDSLPVKPRGGAPYRVGEHTRAVLGDVLGYSRERIEELRRLGTIESAEDALGGRFA